MKLINQIMYCLLLSGTISAYGAAPDQSLDDQDLIELRLCFKLLPFDKAMDFRNALLINLQNEPTGSTRVNYAQPGQQQNVSQRSVVQETKQILDLLDESLQRGAEGHETKE